MVIKWKQKVLQSSKKSKHIFKELFIATQGCECLDSSSSFCSQKWNPTIVTYFPFAITVWITFYSFTRILQQTETPSRSTNNSYWYLHVVGEALAPEFAAVWAALLGSTLLTPQRSTQCCRKYLCFCLHVMYMHFPVKGIRSSLTAQSSFFFPLCATQQHWDRGCLFKKLWASVCIPLYQLWVAAAQHGDRMYVDLNVS